MAGETINEPVKFCAPDHAPEAVHEVALLDAQEIVDDEPAIIELGFAAIETVGAGSVTAIFTLCEALPIRFAQVIV